MKKKAYGAALAALAAEAFTVWGAPVAMAHVVYEDGRVYESGTNCTIVRSEISHGDGGGYRRVDVYAKWSSGDSRCVSNWSRPSGYIAAQSDLMVYQNNQWKICTDGAYHYNSGDASSRMVSKNHGSSPKCGAGYYGSMGYGYVLNGGTWYGGAIWSGDHKLPA